MHLSSKIASCTGMDGFINQTLQYIFNRLPAVHRNVLVPCPSQGNCIIRSRINCCTFNYHYELEGKLMLNNKYVDQVLQQNCMSHVVVMSQLGSCWQLLHLTLNGLKSVILSVLFKYTNLVCEVQLCLLQPITRLYSFLFSPLL